MNESIKLFNHKDASSCNTNDIAEFLDMSVGNLYYHYKNKEHIIRSIFIERIAPAMDAIFFTTDNRETEDDVFMFFLALAKNTYKYRFFYTEMYTLLNNDEELKEFYSKRAQKVSDEITKMYDRWIENGIMKNISEFDKNILTENTWLIGQMWMTHARIMTPDKSANRLIFDEVTHIYHALKPHLTDHSVENFEKMIAFSDCLLKK
ncbi:MAG: TetR/AcrR family transcriptional regulator [Vagococcus sp.]|uniref:TetR/AcrR family transcriptional regulator n=1 Tax=Vagococcus sp. TaxID=1933889 RepID=UPI002FC607FE